MDGFPEALEMTHAAGGLADAAANVGEIYAELARDIRDGERTVADFTYAARLTRLVAAVARAAETGERQTI